MRKILLLLLFLCGCEHLSIPKITIPLKDIHDLKIYEVTNACEVSKLVVCDGGLQKGKLYYEKCKRVYCSKEQKLPVFGFNTDDFPKLVEYLKYLSESYNKK